MRALLDVAIHPESWEGSTAHSQSASELQPSDHQSTSARAQHERLGTRYHRCTRAAVSVATMGMDSMGLAFGGGLQK